ncbi:hypothetical protein IEQ34_004143 [Dendrobium chrysotoxum]|uniref:Uncharacterized protein n=1 Tax=Dendrobium chrysotoxum TaxID=161865 RepID=A0AAV7GYM2_DENCH|nr:hypothetical protein IEQ34_004143 [Dendrobium chrysotoxum]
MASAATLLRLRVFPFLQARALRAAVPRRCSVDISSFQSPQHPEFAVSVLEVTAPRATVGGGGLRGLSPPSLPKQKENSWEDHPDYRRWKDKEGEILLDIDPIKFRTKDILHSDRYRDGERLSAEDEKVVVEKLLAYHPHSEDKIGCGLNSIMMGVLVLTVEHVAFIAHPSHFAHKLIGILSLEIQDASLLCGQMVSGLTSRIRNAFEHTSKKSILLTLKGS